MSSLQSYYGLSSQRGDGMDLSEILPNSSSPPDSTQSIGRGNWATKELVHWFHTPWQKVEADPRDDPFCPDEHVTPLPPCLSVTRVEADVVAVATTDAETST